MMCSLSNKTYIFRVAVCSGKFPDFLMEAWDDYDFRKKSDNDRPGKSTSVAGWNSAI